MRLSELKRHLENRLADVVSEAPERAREAQLIAEHVTGLAAADLILRGDDEAKAHWLKAVDEIVARRQAREPLQYILGSTWFMGLRFDVTRGVFIPRSDTETLVEVCVKKLAGNRKVEIAEIGIGSGCISISLLNQLPKAKSVGLDIAEEAIAASRANADKLGVGDRLELKLGDWRQNLPGNLDLIVSNPPYVPASKKAELAPELTMYEPHAALFGEGEDGLGFFRDIARLANDHLKQNGASFVAVEVGDGQSQAVIDIFSRNGWRCVDAHKDINQTDRAVTAFDQQ